MNNIPHIVDTGASVMNNEPVAWTTSELDTTNWGDTDWQITVTKEKWSDKQIPLYTHPAKTLTLTDEEVEEFEWVLKKHFNFPTNEIVPNLDKIIRAILKKANEK